jgi:membrane protease YdiL (CAAX protease family)
MPADSSALPTDDERRLARRAAWGWAAGVLLLGNLGHLLWGERDRPSERYTIIKALGLLPVTAWALHRHELTIHRETEPGEGIPIWPTRPATETLAGLTAGLALAAPVILSRLTPSIASLSLGAGPPTGFSNRGLAVRLTVSLPLTGVFLEELFFRCLLARRCERAWSPVQAHALSTMLFGLWHLAAGIHACTAPSAAGMSLPGKMLLLVTPPLGTLPAGLVFGWLARRYRTLWPPLLAHWIAAAVLLIDPRDRDSLLQPTSDR